MIRNYEEFMQEARKHLQDKIGGWEFEVDGMTGTVGFGKGEYQVWMTFKYEDCKGIPIQADSSEGLLKEYSDIPIEELRDWYHYIELVLPILADMDKVIAELPPKKFLVMWAETHYFRAEIEAKNKTEIEEKWNRSGPDAYMDQASCVNSEYVENSKEIKEE